MDHDIDTAFGVEKANTASVGFELQALHKGKPIVIAEHVDCATLAAMPVINAVPVVCAAEPGIAGPLDLPRY